MRSEIIDGFHYVRTSRIRGYRDEEVTGMKRIVHNLPPESGHVGQRDQDGGSLLEQAAPRPDRQMGRTPGYRDPDDLFGIWTHCESKTTLRTLSRK
jgi:hypothetical protein